MNQLVVGNRRVQEVELNIPMTDGFRLFCRRWTSSSDPKRAIVCIPGTSGDAQFFRPIGAELAVDGNEVYGLDLRGFGNSVEKGLQRGDTSNFKRHLQDVEEAVQYIRQVHQGKLFMFGHSHGCAYVLWFASNHPSLIDGLVLAAPPVAATSKVHRRDFLMFVLLLIFAPKTMYSFGQNEPEGLASNPLIARKLSIRWLYGSKKCLLDKLFQNASRIQKPTLIIQGDADTSTLPEGAQTLLELLESEDKSIHLFPEADHFLHGALFPTLDYGDPEKKREVATVVNSWLKMR
jgi:alpha-beta hydrolase superfamily lysophospholipase